MTRGQAGYFLANFPQLSREVRSRRDDILNGCRQGEAYASGTRRTGHSDPTANKGILLADGSDLEQVVQAIGLWLNDLSPADRSLLLSTWRLRKYGWGHVARDLKWEVEHCRQRWTYLTRQLAEHLTACAGIVSVQRGDVSVNSLGNRYRE